MKPFTSSGVSFWSVLSDFAKVTLVIASVNGTPIQASQGYTTPSALDGDGNGTFDYREAGTPVTLTTQPNPITITQNKQSTFSVAATTQTTVHYQWQEKVGNGNWTNLTNAGIYSGANTNTLTISKGSLNMNNNLYRCFFKNNAATNA